MLINLLGGMIFNINLAFLVLHTITKSTNVYQGSYAAQVESVDASSVVLPGILSMSTILFDLNTFSLSFTPADVSTQNRKVLQTSGRFKYVPAESDTMAIVAVCTKWNSTLLKRDTVNIYAS